MAAVGPVPQRAVMPVRSSWDEDGGHYKIVMGDVLNGRCESRHLESNICPDSPVLSWLPRSSVSVVKKLGQGTYGRVAEVRCNLTKKAYAVKIIRAIDKYADASKTERRVLLELRKQDPRNVQ